MVTAGGGVAHGAGRARHDRYDPAVIIVAIVLLTLSPGAGALPRQNVRNKFLFPRFLNS